MRKFLIPTIVLALAVACVAAGPSMPANYSRSINFIENTKVGDIVLKAGEYKVVHEMQGEEHVMIFKQGKKDVAKVKCTIESLQAKADRTEQYYSQENGTKVLKGLIFSGDNFRHNF